MFIFGVLAKPFVGSLTMLAAVFVRTDVVTHVSFNGNPFVPMTQAIPTVTGLFQLFAKPGDDVIHVLIRYKAVFLRSRLPAGAVAP